MSVIGNYYCHDYENINNDEKYLVKTSRIQFLPTKLDQFYIQQPYTANMNQPKIFNFKYNNKIEQSLYRNTVIQTSNEFNQINSQKLFKPSYLHVLKKIFF